MLTKRDNMTAKLVTMQCDNARNMADEKETIYRILIIDKKTEREVVDARFYMGKSSSASVVYCSLWIRGAKGDVRSAGRGSAGGYGYHKQSAALQGAIDSAGVELWGSPYNRADEHKSAKQTRAHISGCGSTAAKDACLAMAYSLGSRDAIVID